MLQFENKTSMPVYLSIAHYDSSEGMFMTEDWWCIHSNETITPYAKQLDNRYYYFYAHSSGNNFEWAGDTELNVFHQPFKLKEPSHCVTSHSTKKFKKLDVGNSKSYLVRLTHHSSSPLSEEDQIFIKMFRDAKQLK